MQISYKNKKPKKYFLGGALLASSLIGSAVKGISGANQRKRARKELERLNEMRPTAVVPTAIQRLADEPIAEELMEAQRLGDQRRTSQSLSALSKGGARTLIGGTPALAEAERISELERMGNYEMARKQALSQLGDYQWAADMENRNMWRDQVAGAQNELGAGNLNVMGSIDTALGSLGGIEALNYNPYGNPVNLSSSPNPDGFSVLDADIDWDELLRPVDDTDLPFTAQQGGVTPGEFSHNTNEITMMDEDGDVVGYATGSETVLNKKQRQTMERLAKSGKEKELAAYIRNLYNKPHFKIKRQKS